MPYYHNLTAANVGDYAGRCDPWNVGHDADKYISCGVGGQYIALGETGTYELPPEMYEKLQDGSVKGFGVGMNAPRAFFQFPPTGCELTVTYDA